MQLKYKRSLRAGVLRIGSAVASTALLASVFAPIASADVMVDVTGNGKKSDNTVTLNLGGSTTVKQSNTTKVTTMTNVYANTGKNKANGNTGSGENTIATGAVKTYVSVGVTGNINDATLPNCGCVADLEVKVSGNGVKSDNDVTVNRGGSTTVDQENMTKVKTKTHVKANTGKNKTNDNTGKGSQIIGTGGVESTVEVGVEGGANIL